MNVPQTPPDLGLLWRPIDIADAPNLSPLFNDAAEADDTPERMSPETMAHDLTAYEPLDRRSIVAATERGVVVAYGGVYFREGETEEQRVYVSSYVHPDHRNRGIEEPLVEWTIAAAEGVLAETAAARRYVCAWLYKKLEDRSRIYERRGFTAVRHWWEMERPLAAKVPSTPETGFEVVPWEDGHSAPTRLVHNAAFVDHWGSIPMDEETWRKRMLDSPGFRPDLSYVAVTGGEIVGYAYNEVYEEDWESAGRSEAWIGALGVLRDWRKQGVATALLTKSMQAMQRADLEAAMIGVDSSSPSGAQHLYQAVGFRTTITGTTWQREMT
jgi:GNAT superfamily N-acetyltransferase